MDIQNVLKKLRKLQKLYEGAKKINSEGEAEAAARAIQHLLTEYNLTMADAEAYKTDEEKAKEYVRDDVSGYTYKSIGGKWEMFLLNAICRNFFCRCIRIGSLNHLCIIGQQENVITVKWMKDMLAERFVEFSKEHWKTFKAENPNVRMSKDKFQRSYLMGCATGLDAKLKEQRQKDEQDKQMAQAHHTTVTALVRMNDLAVTNAVQKFVGRVRTYNVSINHDRAYGEGYEDGYHTNINKGIGQARNHVAGALN